MNFHQTETGNNTEIEETIPSGYESFPSRSPFLLLVSGLVLVLCYFIMARELNFFIPRDYTYVSGPQGLVPISDDLNLSYIRYFSPWFLESFFWKLFLLAPAAALLSLGFALWMGNNPIDRITRRIQSCDVRILLGLLSLCALIVILVLIRFVYQKTYITDDENAYVFQAKIMERGEIFAPPPPVEKSFDNTFIITREVYTGKYTLGFPFLLAIGLRIAGACYLMPVLLAVLTISLFFMVGRELFDSRTGLFASMILTCSPFFLFNAANLLSHAANLFFISFFTWTYFRGLKRNSWFAGIAAGLAIGMAFNIRQLTALGFGCPFAFYLLWRFIKGKGKMFPFTLGVILGAIPVFVATLLYNRTLSGSFFRFPFHVYDPLERLGFGPVLDELRYIHTPLKGLQNLLVSLGRYNLWFLGTPISFLFLIPVFFHIPLEKGVRWCLAIILCFFIAYLFYYSPGIPDAGPIYYFELLLPFSLLTARGLVTIHDRMREGSGFSLFRRFFPVFFAFSLALGMISFAPEQALHFMGMTGKIREPYDLVERSVEKPAMVFVKSLPMVGWVFGFRSVDPWLKAPILYCRDLGAEKNTEVMSHFPERNGYILHFDGKKNKNFIQPFSKDDVRKSLQSLP
ncbi:glycosyltransferase family 39 protein [Candidatus Sumerlaeota bacterium]|nr:glycosyltransferase family 39 protein [Candidatus Sumerlaeota bacterium]